MVSATTAACAAGGLAAAYYAYTKLKTVKLTLGYWNIRGLAAPARMMCAYAGACLDDVTYDLTIKPDGGFDASAWTSKKPALAEQNAFMNLPYVIDHDTGTVVTQSTAVYQYIGRKLGLMGSGAVQLAVVEQTLAQAFDLRNDTVELVYPFKFHQTKEAYLEGLKKHLSGSAATNYKKFEEFLGDKAYMAGSGITAGDFHVWELLDQHELMAAAANLPSPLAGYPKLKEYYARIRALPQLATYFASPAYKMPCNNKMAHFK